MMDRIRMFFGLSLLALMSLFFPNKVRSGLEKQFMPEEEIMEDVEFPQVAKKYVPKRNMLNEVIH